MKNQSQKFGRPKNFSELEFVANYEGPLHLLNKTRNTIALAATHQDGQALLDLTHSAQVLDVDVSVDPNKISGTASFFNANGNDALFSTFNGVAPARPPGQEAQQAFVYVIFTGGIGRFEGATGTATVEADLFPERATSKGTIKGTVILPTPNGSKH